MRSATRLGLKIPSKASKVPSSPGGAVELAEGPKGGASEGHSNLLESPRRVAAVGRLTQEATRQKLLLCDMISKKFTVSTILSRALSWAHCQSRLTLRP